MRKRINLGETDLQGSRSQMPLSFSSDFMLYIILVMSLIYGVLMCCGEAACVPVFQMLLWRQELLMNPWRVALFNQVLGGHLMWSFIYPFDPGLNGSVVIPL